MLKARIIPTLLLKNSRMVKGVAFSEYKDVGDPVSAAKIYNAQNADELVFIDIDATQNNRKTLLEVVSHVSKECFMPLTVGGGVRQLDDIQALTQAGADKVLITTMAFENPSLIKEAAEIFGEQCIVCGIDANMINQKYRLYSHCGQMERQETLIDHIQHCDQLGAGELFISGIHRDGSKQGYDLELLKIALGHTHKPVVISGGAGNFNHLAEAIQLGASGVACASLFHFGDNNPIRARSYLKNQKIPVREYK
jgi:cyclase